MEVQVEMTELKRWPLAWHISFVQWINSVHWSGVCLPTQCFNYWAVDKLNYNTEFETLKVECSSVCVFIFVRAAKKAKLSNEWTDSGSSRLTLCSSSLSFVGNTEIDVDIKRYYCKAGIKSIQVRNVPIFDLLLHADKGTVFFAPLMASAVAVRKEVWAWQMETFDGNEAERLGKAAGFRIWILSFLALRWCFFLFPNKLLMSRRESSSGADGTPEWQ